MLRTLPPPYRGKDTVLLNILGRSLVLDLNADNPDLEVVAGAVKTWPDASLFKNHVAQATAGQRPSRVLNVLNGRAALRFVGASSQFLGRLTFSGVAAGDSPRVYAVGSFVGATPAVCQGALISVASSATLGTGNCDTIVRFNSASGLVYQQNAFGTVISNSAAGCNSVPALFDGRFTTGPSTLSLAVNGADVQSATSNAAVLAGTPDRCYVGVREDTTTQLLTGDVFRLLYVNPAPTAAQHTVIKTYLKSLYPSIAIV